MQAAPALTLDIRWRDRPPPSTRATDFAWQAIQNSSAATSGVLHAPHINNCNKNISMKVSAFPREIVIFYTEDFAEYAFYESTQSRLASVETGKRKPEALLFV